MAFASAMRLQITKSFLNQSLIADMLEASEKYWRATAENTYVCLYDTATPLAPRSGLAQLGDISR